MQYCLHFQYDDDSNKFVSLAVRYVGNHNPNKVYRYHCKRCGLPLHRIDVINLNNKINDMNKDISGEPKNILLPDLSDIHDMLAPVPHAYHEDSKYRDNQLR